MLVYAAVSEDGVFSAAIGHVLDDPEDALCFDFWSGSRSLALALSPSGEETAQGEVGWELTEGLSVFGAPRFEDVSFALRGLVDGEVLGACKAIQHQG